MKRLRSYVIGHVLSSVQPALHQNSLAWRTGGVLRLFLLAAAAGFLLAIFGPFGSYESMPLAERLVFWELVLLCASVVHVPTLWLADRLGQVAAVPTVLWVIGSGLTAAAPTALIVTGLMVTMFGLLRASSFASMYLYVVSISVPMQVLSYFVLRGEAGGPDKKPEAERPLGATAPSPPAAPYDQPEPAPPPFDISLLGRMPAQLGSDVQCLEMQDHYVRVHTNKGSTLLLMRLRDAEARLGTLEGKRVHRSWWVARNAVIGVQRRGQSVALELSNGLSVPVSRARLGELRATGWLGDHPTFLPGDCGAKLIEAPTCANECGAEQT